MVGSILGHATVGYVQECMTIGEGVAIGWKSAIFIVLKDANLLIAAGKHCYILYTNRFKGMFNVRSASGAQYCRFNQSVWIFLSAHKDPIIYKKQIHNLSFMEVTCPFVPEINIMQIL